MTHGSNNRIVTHPLGGSRGTSGEGNPQRGFGRLDTRPSPAATASDPPEGRVMCAHGTASRATLGGRP